MMLKYSSSQVLFATIANGTLPIPPTIIHQGPELQVSGEAIITSELDENGELKLLEQGFLVIQTPSGYNNDNGFMAIAKHLDRYLDPRRPRFLFVDGHDSHFCPEALKLLEGCEAAG